MIIWILMFICVFLPRFFVTVVLFNVLVNLGGKNVAYALAALMSVVYALIPMPELFCGVNRVFKYIGFYAMGVALAGKVKTSVIDKRKVASGGASIILITLNFILTYYGLTMSIMWFVNAMFVVIGTELIVMLINLN